LRHEGIVAVYDVGEDKEEDILFLIMELLEGQNLDNYLESKHGRLDFTASCDIILQICDVLQYAHKRGISHGGIKPQNIFINPDGGIKLLDFGLAKLLSPGRLTRFSIGFGIDCYMAPEQSAGREIDARADIFALGVVFYQMLIRQEPFYFKWPSGVDAVIKNCLKPQPGERFQDVASLAEEIRRVRGTFLERAHEPAGLRTLENEKERDEEKAVIIHKNARDKQDAGGHGEKEKTLVIVAFILIILTLIGTGAYRYFSNKEVSPPEISSQSPLSGQAISRGEEKEQIGREAETTVETGSALTATQEPDTSQQMHPPERAEGEKVASLLAKAEGQFKEQKYTSPFRDNVFATLREVLNIQAGNSEAKRMIERIRDIYMIKGDRVFTRKDYLKSGIYFQKALYVSPGYAPAQRRLEEVNTMLRAKLEPDSPDSETPFQSQIERETESLLAKAEKQVNAEKYTYPSGENAFITIQKVLRIDPGNHEAEMILENIRDEYMKLGEKSLRKGDFRKAKRHLGKALYVYPGFTPAEKMLSEADSPPRGAATVNPGRMVLVHGGCYQMGDIFRSGYTDESPVHEVCVNDFYLDVHEVTQGDFRKIRGYSPSSFKGETLPVENVTWFDAREYCEKSGGRLPTEAEWEYAARNRGRNEEWSGTSVQSNLGDYAWYELNSQGKTAQVGMKKPNALGLYDMSGNMFEWVQDWYGDRYYERSLRKDPQGPNQGVYKILRGGSWNTTPRYLRTTTRFRVNPDNNSSSYGFRCARDG
jgi:formylglycine-generating enzyme required for sulfatase activity